MRAAQLGTPDREITRLPIVKRNLLRMRLMAHPVFFPNQRQQPGNHDRHKEQHADHRQRKADIIGKPDAIVAVEEKPGRQCEPGDEADRGSINPRVKLIEYGPVVGDKFPAHENRLSGFGWDRASSTRCAGTQSPTLPRAKLRNHPRRVNVEQYPPTIVCCSIKRTDRPARANRLPQIRPPIPAPTTTASYDGASPRA